MKENTHSADSKSHKPQGLFFQIIKASILLAVAVLIFNQPAVYKFAESSLMLNRSDMVMIPFSTFFFFIFWKIMEKYVFLPYLKLHEARELATEGSTDLASKSNQEAEEILSESQNKIGEAQRDAMKAKIDMVEAEQENAAAKIAEAEATALEQLQKSQQEVKTKVAELEQDLNTKVDDLVGEIVDKLKSSPRTV